MAKLFHAQDLFTIFVFPKPLSAGKKLMNPAQHPWKGLAYFVPILAKH